MNTKKKIRNNLIVGIASQVVTIILGIIVPRLVLTSYGSEINGLINSVTQIYSYIGLLEAGVGFATIQALYKTIGQNNIKATNAVLAATNHFYHRTGLLYLVAVLIFSCVYPLLALTEVPVITIVWVIIFNGLGNVINYFFQGKYFLLLQAEGKNYIQNFLNLVTNVFKNIAKIALMAAGFDVVFVQAIAMAVSLIQMLYVTWYIHSKYTWIDLAVEPDYTALSQSKNVLVHQVSGLIFNNTDMIVLSVFCGLKVVSVYSMYTLLFGMISTVLNTISSSIVFTLGQTFHQNRERFMRLYHCFEVYYMATVFALYSTANFFILPFMKLYTAGIHDINYIDPKLPLLFISTYLLSCGRSAPNQAINIAGHFKLTQNRSIVESAINLVVSLLAVQKFGIYGVLIGTLAALLYRTNDIIFYANHKILNQTVITTYKRWSINVVVFACILCGNTYLTISLDSYVKIFLWCIPYTAITVATYLTVASLFNKKIAIVGVHYLKEWLFHS